MTTLTLERMPPIGANYFKAALSLGRRPEGAVSIPELSATLPELRVDAGQLAAYREICGFAAGGDDLPITFPQVIAAAIQMHLLNQRDFPVPLIGLVHLRNKIEQRRALKADEVFAVHVRIEGGGTTSDKGLEFDIVTGFQVGGESLWQATATVLHRAKKKADKPGGKKPVPAAASALAQYASFDAPADVGRRYGRISGDMNPIHLSPWSAKLLGYPRAIAHGMWSLARCAAQLEPQLAGPPKLLEAAFKQPLFLPGRVALKHQPASRGVEFSLLSRNSDKVHLVGLLA